MCYRSLEIIYGPKWSWADLVMGRNDPEPSAQHQRTRWTRLQKFNFVQNLILALNNSDLSLDKLVNLWKEKSFVNWQIIVILSCLSKDKLYVKWQIICRRTNFLDLIYWNSHLIMHFLPACVDTRLDHKHLSWVWCADRTAAHYPHREWCRINR